MDKESFFSSRPPCPYCGSHQILKNGSTHHKKPKFLCKEYGKFYTDLWESYCGVIPQERHYPSTKKSGETTRIEQGNASRFPRQAQVLFERLNNTLRHRCSRLVRKNLAFSKNFFNHEGAILYFIHHYNEEILST
ncbi:hypothetical protein CY0110_29159 [Crocosphaera chwakensis CCY0110]|uniref:Transposase n=1 Tax=Crocosphaera chwakensis CCY0110 TaxID=391612 RepID=A3IUS6_9CHRO|nr:hypothetical protein CY0110_29159 [Crocosphaera chwakensis CCY0110]